MTGGIVLAPKVVSKNHLRTWIIGIASITEEFSNILNILTAASEFILASFVVDADEEGLLSRHDCVYRILKVEDGCGRLGK